MSHELDFEFPILLSAFCSVLILVFSNIFVREISEQFRRNLIISCVFLSVIIACIYSMHKKEEIELLIREGKMVTISGLVKNYTVHNAKSSFYISDEELWLNKYDLYCVDSVKDLKDGMQLTVSYVDLSDDPNLSQDRCILRIRKY